MSLRFIPPKEVNRYALFVDYGNGRGRMKAYDMLGSAKNAYRHNRRSDVKILENVDGNWYVLHDVKAGTEYEDLPWVKEVEGGTWRARYTRKKAVPMTRDEYADWRIKVERERMAEQFDIDSVKV